MFPHQKCLWDCGGTGDKEFALEVGSTNRMNQPEAQLLLFHVSAQRVFV